MKSRELEATLQACKRAASEGENIARNNCGDINKTIKSIKIQKDHLVSSLSSSSIKIPLYCQQLITQIDGLLKDCCDLHKEIVNDLDSNNSKLSLFNIVVYGRTKAGKSTLMETLTKGNGQSIGKGAQRTTLDVRKYEWNGMTIFDTPGIAAAAEGGRDDEAKAYEVAKYADLLIFLTSDDAPQQEEAKAFAMLKEMGKPILVIFNVKASNSSDSDFSKMRLRDLKKKMALERIDTIKDQFMKMSGLSGGECENIVFVHADIHSGYLVRCKSPSAKNFTKEDLDELWKLSTFEKIEDEVTKEIEEKGSFYQYKVYVDIVYKGILDVQKKLRQQYVQSNLVSTELINGLSELKLLNKKIKHEADRRIDAFVEFWRRNLKNLAADFSRDNYENKKAAKAWQREVESTGMFSKAEDCLQEIAEEANERLEAFVNIFRQHINISQRITGGVNGETVFDTGGNLRIAIALGGLGLVAYFGAAILSGPVGWVLVGLSILTYFCTSREKKIREAIEKMEDELNDWISEFMPKFKTGLNACAKEKIYDAILDKTYNQFEVLEQQVGKIITIQKLFIESNNEKLTEMNKQLFERGLDHIGKEKLKSKIFGVARVPGVATVVEVNRNGYATVQEELLNLGKVFQEVVIVVIKDDNVVRKVSNILRVDPGAIRADEDKKIMYLGAEKVDSDFRGEKYFGIVEQLTGFTMVLEGQLSEKTFTYNQETIGQSKETLSNKNEQSKDSVKELKLEWYGEGVDLENVDIQWDVAWHFYKGIDVDQNYKQAFEWAKKAAKQRLGIAQCYVGDCFYFGMGIGKNFKEAVEWYKLAEEQGYVAASKYLGDCYYFGDGVRKDYGIAAQYYEKAAESGVVEAIFNLGNCYYAGEGEKQDYSMAAKNYRLAAMRNYGDAQNNLGNCYYCGVGVDQNYAEAKKWYERALNNHCQEAKENLKNF